MVHDVRVLALNTSVIGLQLVVADVNAVLVVTLILVQRVVLADVLNIRASLITGVVRLRALICIRRVALWVIDALVAVKNRGTRVVEVGASVVVIVVASRILTPCLYEAVVLYNGADGIKPLFIGVIGLFLFICQSVQANVLLAAAARGGGEGVGLCGLLRNLTPLGVRESIAAVDGHTALVELLAVAQHIL